MAKKKPKFEWDEWNTIKNWVKHQVRPFEAEEAFIDKYAKLASDPGHSEIEYRWSLIGRTRKNRTLATAFTIRNRRVRIISMRDANKKEVVIYEEAIKATKI